MHRLLLGFAAVAAAATTFSTPSAAKHFVGGGIPEAKSTVGTLPPSFARPGRQGFDGCSTRGDRHSGRDRDFSACGSAFTDWYGGEWALYNNRSWEPDSYNDWWHDRPDRAFPRWVQHNQNCTEDRMWWSGSGWHC